MQKDYKRQGARSANEGMSIKQWLGTFFIMLIPVVNIIAFFVWLFGGGKNRTRINFVRASLIWAILITAIFAIIMFVFLNQLKDLFGEYIPEFQRIVTRFIPQ